MAAKKPKIKKIKVGSDAFWSRCKRVREKRLDLTKIKSEVDLAQVEVATAMLAAGGKGMSSDRYGLKVTVTQTETPVYDGDDLWDALTPKQRPLVFDRSLDLMALSPERRAEVLKAVRGLLTKAERDACTVDRLNVERLSQAVQAGEIEAATVAPFTTWRKNAPYITVTPHGA